MIAELIESAVIVEDLTSTDKGAALEELVQALVTAGPVSERDAREIGRRVAERESIGTTGIGNGVAVPHVKIDGALGVAMVLARSQAGIDYQAIDGCPVHTLFLIVAPVDRAEDHLQALRWISALARNADFRRFVRAAAGEAEIRELLREMSSPA